MQINVTFIVQIINFGVTYAFLHKLILKPAVGNIQMRRAQRQGLLDKINTKEQRLKGLIAEKSEALEVFRHDLKKKYEISPPASVDIATTIAYKEDEQDIERVVGQGAQFLVKGVIRACK